MLGASLHEGSLAPSAPVSCPALGSVPHTCSALHQVQLPAMSQPRVLSACPLATQTHHTVHTVLQNDHALETEILLGGPLPGGCRAWLPSGAAGPWQLGSSIALSTEKVSPWQDLSENAAQGGGNDDAQDHAADNDHDLLLLRPPHSTDRGERGRGYSPNPSTQDNPLRLPAPYAGLCLPGTQAPPDTVPAEQSPPAPLSRQLDRACSAAWGQCSDPLQQRSRRGRTAASSLLPGEHVSARPTRVLGPS